MNTFGQIFRLTTFGESHGEAIGGVVDGMPAGIEIDIDFIQKELSRRRPGQSSITTSRKEPDEVELLSGVFEGRSTGCPIGFIVRNQNQHSSDYDNMRQLFRPSHADYTYYIKYGTRDHRGGGRSSARITISRCVAGALAKLALRQLGISVQAYTSQVGDIALERDYHLYDLSQTESNAVRCPDVEKAQQIIELIATRMEIADELAKAKKKSSQSYWDEAKERSTNTWAGIGAGAVAIGAVADALSGPSSKGDKGGHNDKNKGKNAPPKGKQGQAQGKQGAPPKGGAVQGGKRGGEHQSGTRPNGNRNDNKPSASQGSNRKPNAVQGNNRGGGDRPQGTRPSGNRDGSKPNAGQGGNRGNRPNASQGGSRGGDRPQGSRQNGNRRDREDRNK